MRWRRSRARARRARENRARTSFTGQAYLAFFIAICRECLWRLRVFSEGWGDFFGGFSGLNCFGRIAKKTEALELFPTLTLRPYCTTPLHTNPMILFVL